MSLLPEKLGIDVGFVRTTWQGRGNFFTIYFVSCNLIDSLKNSVHFAAASEMGMCINDKTLYFPFFFSLSQFPSDPVHSPPVPFNTLHCSRISLSRMSLRRSKNETLQFWNFTGSRLSIKREKKGGKEKKHPLLLENDPTCFSSHSWKWLQGTRNSLDTFRR